MSLPCGLSNSEGAFIHSVMQSAFSRGVIEKILKQVVDEQKILGYDGKPLPDYPSYLASHAYAECAVRLQGILKTISQTYEEEVLNAGPEEQ